jgi:amino acid adenylation domain-containing protein
MTPLPLPTLHRPFARTEIEGCIPSRFAKVVEEHASRHAVSEDGVCTTYGELNTAADAIAATLLRERGPTAEPVAVLFSGGVGAIAAILGILKAGKFYVAIDPAAPQLRQQEILTDAGARCMVTNEHHAGAAHELVANMPSLLVLHEFRSDGNRPLPARPVAADAPMGLFYTSGSTGKPKGIEISHRYVLKYCWTVNHCGHLSSGDRQGLVFFSGFAAGLGVIFSTLLNGATLCPLDASSLGIAQFIERLRQECITFLYPSVSLFREMLDQLGPDNPLPSMRRIFLAGQTVYRRDVDRFQELTGTQCVLLLGFSSTEGGALTEFPIAKDTRLEGAVVPVGWPVPGVDVLLFDDAGRRVGPRECGEIGVRSPFLATGYWRNPELTEQKFLPDPDGGPDRVFLTGDLGRFNAAGGLELIGRKDFQVKIRGYRVELAEIEAALFAVESVRQAVVVAHESSSGSQRLMAYVVPASQPPATSKELRLALCERLPHYMIPSTFVFLPALPLTPTGKVDRRALPQPEDCPEGQRETFTAPVTAVEKLIATIWEQVLDIRPVGLHDHFFELGGHSLLALQVVNRVQKALALAPPSVFQLHGTMPLTIGDFLRAPTVAGMAAQLASQPSPVVMPIDGTYIVPLRTTGPQRPLFILPGGCGEENELLIFASMVPMLDPERPVFGVRSRISVDRTARWLSISARAALIVEEMCRIQPRGPYLLLGECVAGTVAMEITRLLESRSSERNAVYLLDTPPPAPTQRPRWLSWWRSRDRTEPEQPPASARIPRRLASYYRTLERWQPRHVHSRLCVIVSAANPAADQIATEWRRWAAGDYTTLTVPGNHHTYIREHADGLARTLNQEFAGL